MASTSNPHGGPTAPAIAALQPPVGVNRLALAAERADNAALRQLLDDVTAERDYAIQAKNAAIVQAGVSIAKASARIQATADARMADLARRLYDAEMAAASAVQRADGMQAVVDAAEAIVAAPTRSERAVAEGVLCETVQAYQLAQSDVAALADDDGMTHDRNALLDPRDLVREDDGSQLDDAGACPSRAL